MSRESQKWLVGMNMQFILPPHDASYPFYSSTFRGYDAVLLKNAYVPASSNIVYKVKNTFKVVLLETSQRAEECDPSQVIPQPTCWIHVDKTAIQQNATTGSCKPVCTVTTAEGTVGCNEIRILGPCVVVYEPHATPTVVIKTASEIEIVS